MTLFCQNGFLDLLRNGGNNSPWPENDHKLLKGCLKDRIKQHKDVDHQDPQIPVRRLPNHPRKLGISEVKSSTEKCRKKDREGIMGGNYPEG